MLTLCLFLCYTSACQKCSHLSFISTNHRWAVESLRFRFVHVMFLFCLIPINLLAPFIQLIKADIGASAVGDSRCPSESRKQLKAEDENRWNVTSSAPFYVAGIQTVTSLQAYEIGTFLNSDILLKGQCTRANICYKQFLIVTKINVTSQLITKFPDIRSLPLTTNANIPRVIRSFLSKYYCFPVYYWK